MRVSSEGAIPKGGRGDDKKPGGEATTAAGNEDIRQAQGTSGQHALKEVKDDGAGLVWKF